MKTPRTRSRNFAPMRRITAVAAAALAVFGMTVSGGPARAASPGKAAPGKTKTAATHSSMTPHAATGGAAGADLRSGGSSVRRKGRDVLTHTVQPGQNLYRIALQYGVSVDDLRSLNRLGGSSQVRAGRVLALPTKSEAGPAGAGTSHGRTGAGHR